MAMYGFDLPDLPTLENVQQQTSSSPHLCDEKCVVGCERKFVPSYVPRWARPHCALFPESPLACPMCYNDWEFNTTEDLQKHMDICPITDKVLNNFKDGIQITCRVTRVIPVGDRKTMITQYEDVDIDEKTVFCPVCGIGATSLDLLLPHLDVHVHCGLCKWYYICTSCYRLSNNTHDYQQAIRHYAKDHGSMILKMMKRNFFNSHLKKEFEGFIAHAQHEYLVWYP